MKALGFRRWLGMKFHRLAFWLYDWADKIDARERER